MATATTTPAGTTPRTLARASRANQAATTLDPVQRFGAIQNALSMALFFVHQPCAGHAEQAANLWAATARANRALTLLKAASAAHAAAGAATSAEALRAELSRVCAAASAAEGAPRP